MTARRHSAGVGPIVAAAAVALAVVNGCGDQGPPNPAPRQTGGGGAAAISTGGAPPAPPFKRSITRRSLFGGPPGNLLIDGDFEYSVILEGTGPQAGWYVFSGMGQGYLTGETGGLCRSGLRCARMLASQSLFGQGAAAESTGMIGRVWAKPPVGRECAVIQPELLHCNFSGFATQLAAVSEQPGPDGWCQYRAAVARQQTAMCMYIDNTLDPDESALVDTAAILPDDGTTPLVRMQPLGGDRYARRLAISRWIQRHRPFGEVPQPIWRLGRR